MKKRFVQIDGELVEVSPDWIPEPRADYHIMPDIKPYKSMINGQEIGSRSTHREHLRQHGCIEIGNEKVIPKPIESPKGLHETIRQLSNERLRRQ